MKYSGLIKNDFSAAPGTCVSFFVQGCPLQCPGCHNQDTWDFNGGREFRPETIQEIYDALTANGVKRKLCIMGGEPLCQENQFLTLLVVNTIKEKLPETEIYLWTGYNLDNLIHTGKIDQILAKVDCVVDGPFIFAERDVTLFMRGSKNQRILYKGKDY